MINDELLNRVVDWLTIAHDFLLDHGLDMAFPLDDDPLYLAELLKGATIDSSKQTARVSAHPRPEHGISDFPGAW